MASSDDDWAVYWANVEGSHATIVVDLSWQARAPDPSRPMLVEVSVPFRRATQDGLPDALELSQLEPINDLLTAVMERELDAVSVGAMSCNGRRRWYFYTSTAECDAVVHRAFSASEYEPKWGAKSDAEWSGYKDTLYPKPEELRWIWDIRVLSELQQHGDDATRERSVDHFAHFEKRSEAERFANWCASEGFTMPSGETLTVDDGRFGVEFTHIGPATIESIHPRTSAADLAARQMGGEYDGWGTTVMKRPWWRLGR
ncbi:MAG: DUF695 domain-containing protein [Planctomycetota bacterium]